MENRIQEISRYAAFVDNFYSFRLDVIDKIKAFRVQNGCDPETIHLTKEDEDTLNKVSVSDVGDSLIAPIIVFGAKASLPKFLGLHTRWGMKERSVQ